MLRPSSDTPYRRSVSITFSPDFDATGWLADAIKQTQKKKSNLAAHMGVAPPAISFRLNGRTKISPDWLQEAPAFLGVSLPADAFPIDVAPEPAETTDVAEPDRNADGETDDANDAVSEAENQTETEDSDHFAALIEKSQNDAGAAFERPVLDALAEMKANDPAQWQRLRKRLKDVGVRLTDLERAMRTASGQETDGGDSQAVLLFDLASNVDLYRDANGDAFADLIETGVRRTMRLRWKGFKQTLARRFYDARGGAANSNAMQAALDVLEAQANFEGEVRDVHLRVANHNGAVYLDVGDDKWSVIRITADGWKIISSADCRVRFRRTSGMLPLPTPNPDGDIGCLFELLNVKTENGRVLSAGFLLGVLRGKGPFAAVILTGEQGSAKSTFSTILRSIIDPHAAPTRRISRNADDLFIAARHNAVIVFDNISRLTEEVSDGLCILATGGGHAKRELYSDADETVLNYCRPFILNGIEGVADKADLIDRAICIELDIIPEDKRKTEADVWASFAAAHPDILGALLNAVATGLQRDGTIKHPSNLPRMADFAMWGMACETAFWPDGTLLAAYEQNRELSADVMIDGDLVARSVSLLVEQQTNESWTGTSSELLPLLAVIVGQEETRSDKWLKDATRLSTALMRVSPVLRKRGIEVKRSRVGTSRFISIQKTSRTDVEEKTVDLASPASPNGAEPEGYDARDASDANCTGDSLTGINDKKPDDKIKSKNSDATPVCVCQW